MSDSNEREGNDTSKGKKSHEVQTSEISSRNSVLDALNVSSIEKGHRLGNFHNYYTFHPSTSRLDALDDCKFYDQVVENFYRVKTSTTESSPKRSKLDKDNRRKNERIMRFKYCDLGCNEGDMTFGIAEKILSAFQKRKEDKFLISMDCLGLDIDDTLISRAEQKSKNQSEVHSKFLACNLCDEADHNSKCRSFLSLNEGDYSLRFDLITIFSTTMWIHVHGGDDGLQSFLERACEMTDMLLIEPQSSKSYRKINKRLRKMSRPDVKIISNLKLRAKIENEIARIVISFGFEKVDLQHSLFDGKKKAWDRELQLYRRKSS